MEGWKTIEAYHVEPKTLVAVMGTFSAFGVIILLLMAALGFYFKKHKVSMEALTQAELSLFMQGDPDSINYSSTTFQDQVSLLPYDVTIEFPKDNLKLGRQIGSGAFGRVLKAQAFGLEPYEKSSIVAVKTLKPDSCKQHLQALLSEIKILSHLGKHANIVNLKGAVTTNIMSGEVYVLVEYCKFGNIQKFLLNHRDKFIDQINPETGKYDSQYPSDLYRRMEQNGLG